MTFQVKLEQKELKIPRLKLVAFHATTDVFTGVYKGERRLPRSPGATLCQERKGLQVLRYFI